MSAGTLALLLDAPAAVADDVASNTRTFDHTYEGLHGEEVTCRIYANSSIFRHDGQAGANAISETQISGSGCFARLGVRVQYTAIGGEPVETFASSRGITLEVYSDRIATDYVATHNILFEGCSANCRVNFQTRPK